MSIDFKILKRWVLSIGFGFDKDQQNNLLITPAFVYNKAADDDIYEYDIKTGHSISFCWLGYYVGMSFCKRL